MLNVNPKIENSTTQAESLITERSVEKVPSPNVTRWLSHPKIEEYAQRFRAGESLEEMLKGQESIEDKVQAIRILAEHLVETSAESSNTSSKEELVSKQVELTTDNKDELEPTNEELEQELQRTCSDMYWKRRNTLRDDLFLAAQGADPDGESSERMYESVDGSIASKFDAHGIDKGNQLESLLALLRDGINPERSFYTAPFDIPDEDRAALGAALGTAGGTAYKAGMAVVTAGYGEKLQEAGIKHVFINDVYRDMIPVLKKRFPNVAIHALSEQKTVLEDEANQFLAQNKVARDAGY